MPRASAHIDDDAFCSSAGKSLVTVYLDPSTAQIVFAAASHV